MKFILPTACILAAIVSGCHTDTVGRRVPVDSLSLIELTVVSTNDLKPLDHVTISWSVLTNAAAERGQTNDFTGTDGMARVRAPVGMYWYSISKVNWLPSEFQITIKAGQTTNLAIQLVPAPRISGVVRDPSGAPAVGVPVSFHPGFYPGASEYTEAKTDANGRYELILQQQSSGLFDFWNGPMSMTNFIMARDLEKNLAAILEFAGSPSIVDLTLQPGITLSGSVKDIRGLPVSNATVEVSFLCGNSIRKMEERPTHGDSQGLFSVPALPQGRDYEVLNGVTAKGYGTAYGHVDAKNTKTNHYEFPAFVLKRANRKLAGRVMDINWKPLAGASVWFYGQGQPLDSTTNTDSKGNFVFDAVCNGPVTIYTSYQDPFDSDVFMRPVSGDDLEAQAGDTNILIQLHDISITGMDAPTLITKGTVFNPSGKPAAEVAFAVWRSANPFRTYSSDSDGKYRVRWQGPGVDVKSVLVARDMEQNLAASHDLKASTTKLNIRLQPGCTLSGSVQDADGRPITNAAVSLDMTLNYACAELAKTQVDPKGEFSFNALPRKGEYSLDVTTAGYGSATIATNFAKSGQAIRLPFRLTLANLQIAGTVFGLDGRPVPGIVVNASGQRQMLVASTVTDAQGHFVFNEVARGPILVCGIIKTSNDDGYASNPFVTAQGGDTNIVLRLVVPATHGAMEAWRAGDRRSAINHFLDVDWSVRPLFDSYRVLSLSEEQFVALSDAEREARSKEMIKQVDTFRKLVAAVFEAGHDAAAKGDDAQARKIFTSLKQCGAALDSRDCLRLLRIVGQHLKEKADSALVLVRRPKLQ
jgi:protocatechuate 3,4-dioxygenase beta subunit